jgi:hypothetical protein
MTYIKIENIDMNDAIELILSFCLFFSYMFTYSHSILYDILFDKFILFFNYDDNKDENEDEESDDDTNDEVIEEKVVEKYEDKYLQKYKLFSNEYSFSDEELKLEKEKYEEYKKNSIFEAENFGFDVIEETELIIKAKEYVINEKLNNLINNYILETTPLGNIFMRYNNKKKSFEYFSNNTIPYRYLEPVGRKYVLTYHCKSIFIDLEEELKKAQEKLDDELKKAQEKKEEESQNKIIKTKDLFVKLKTYNKDTKPQTQLSQPQKNREGTNFVLPPQIKANLPNVNSNEPQLLKENANRYTWEGRLANFSILKTAKKNVFDKNYSLTFSDFKQMKQINSK